MHPVFLHYTRCLATACYTQHREMRSQKIAPTAQFVEAENSVPSGRDLSIVRGGVRAESAQKIVQESLLGLVPT